MKNLTQRRRGAPPPETVIDFNATYLGKNGVPIRREFYQGVNRVLCRVENGNGPTEFSLVVSLQP